MRSASIALLLFAVAALLIALALVCSMKENAPPAIDFPSTAAAPITVAHPTENYVVGPRWDRHGSCLHASVIDLLEWRGLDDLAAYWRAHFGGAATMSDVAAIGERLNLKCKIEENGDEQFLDYCAQNRLGAAISWSAQGGPGHAIVFCGYENDQAVLLGVNRPEVCRMPKAEFIAQWKRCFGEAFTILP